MTIGDWLSARTPRPPDALRARLDEILGGELHRDAAAASDCFLAAGESLAASLLGSRSTSRQSALDLLAADALVTYAFEAASESPRDITERAAAAMVRIAALGAA